MKVYIGVGHGGIDPGAVKYLVEKDINLKMAIACRDYLSARGIECMMSREDDSTKSVTQKVAECNKFGANLAIDIHNNAGGGDGFEIYHSINKGTGKTLAENIETEVKKIGQNSRGLKTKRGANGDYFGFIRLTKCPAVIAEGVFVDNAADAAQADTDEECKKFGQAYARGFLKTFGIADTEISTGQVKQEPVTQRDKEDIQYRVRVTSGYLRIRKGPGTNYSVTGFIKDKGVYTIVEESNGAGANRWGRLKSGAGWISLDYTKDV